MGIELLLAIAVESHFESGEVFRLGDFLESFLFLEEPFLPALAFVLPSEIERIRRLRLDPEGPAGDGSNDANLNVTSLLSSIESAVSTWSLSILVAKPI